MLFRSYSCDADATKAVTILGGQLFVVDLLTDAVSTPAVAPGVFDARLSPDGTRIAYVRGASLCVCDPAGNERVIAHEDSANVSWGSADFIAAEEMGRQRGYWWSPEGTHIAACRVDESPVDVWHIADPAHPERGAVEHRYPAAGTQNALVELAVINVATSARVPVSLPVHHEYLNSVSWTDGGLIAQTQTRDQRAVTVSRIDPSTGDCTTAQYAGPLGIRALADELAVLRPQELLLATNSPLQTALPEIAQLKLAVTAVDGWVFEPERARRTLLDQLRAHGLEGFGLAGQDAAVCAAGGLIAHLRDTQKADLAHIRHVRYRSSTDSLFIDPVTLRHLEIVTGAEGKIGRAHV